MSKRGQVEAGLDSREEVTGLPLSKMPKATQIMPANRFGYSPALDISGYSGSVWYILNKKYKSSKGSVEYERAGDATSEVTSYVKSIRKEATALNSSSATKKSALETLR